MKRAFTTREKVMLLVLTVLLIVIAYFKLILEPINNSIDEYQSETAAEQDEILQNTALLTRMSQMQKELEEIYAEGDPTPIPNYDNSGKLLVELNSILSASVDYSLDFGQVSALNDGYIMCRPINMAFTTNTYAETRAIIDALHNSDFTNQISDISVQFENSGKLLVELNSILSASVDYSLDFGQVSALNDGYIMCRPINMAFTTNTYAETRAIIDALHNSDFTNQISDISVQFENSGSSGNVQVNLYITYFELQK